MALPQIQDPRKKRQGPFSDAPVSAVPPVTAPNTPSAPSMLPTKIVHPSFMDKLAAGPRAFGGLPNAPAPGSAMAQADAAGLSQKTNVLGMPTGYTPPVAPLRSGEAAPDVNPLAAGTTAGLAVRDAYKAGANDITDAANASLKGGTALVNHLTSPLRSATGTGVDFMRALVGANARPNAGQSYAPLPAPQLKMPYAAKPPVQFVIGGAPTGPTAGPATSAPTSTPATAAAPSAADARNFDPAADNISQANLAAAMRLPTTPDNGGGTGATITQPGAGVTIGGRSLPVGAMVNGVPTFSDGTGGIARTMSDDQIKHYGDNLSRADAGALSNVLASDVTGSTPTQGQMVDQRVAQIQRPITGSRPTAQQFADAERTAIAQRDPRSAAGIAARNLSIDAQYGGTPRLRRMAETALANLQAGSQQSGIQAQQAEAQATNTDATGQNALQAIQLRGTLDGQNQLANTALKRGCGHQLPASRCNWPMARLD